MNTSSANLTLLQGACPLPSLGVIEARGEDAASFLHNQLTNDVLLLPVGQARLAAWCNAKGRMLVSMLVIKSAQDCVLLVLPAELLAQTLKRLSMFVLRAKVRLSDASAQWQLQGLLGSAAQALTGDASPWQTTVTGRVHAVALYPAVLGHDRAARALWLAPADAPQPATPLPAAGLWPWAEVLSGVTYVTAPLAEAFVPQMLNYESVGGVNFKKGCYPGQEVVARSQYRGTLKRRTVRAFSQQPLQAGQELHAPDDPEQPCATVVQAAARPDGAGWDALVCGSPQMREIHNLHILDTPYAILDDIN